MGLGIGKDCLICNRQLDYQTGFNQKEDCCSECERIIPKVLEYLSTKRNENL